MGNNMATKKKKAVKTVAKAKPASTVKTAKKKAVTKKAVKKKAVKKIAVKNTQAESNKIKVTLEQQHKMICEAAYYISLEKTHETVNPTEDWLQAEAAIKKICTVHSK
jgi:hypothetical protein